MNVMDADLQLLSQYYCKTETLQITVLDRQHVKRMVVQVPQGLEVEVQTLTDPPPNPPPK